MNLITFNGNNKICAVMTICCIALVSLKNFGLGFFDGDSKVLDDLNVTETENINIGLVEQKENWSERSLNNDKVDIGYADSSDIKIDNNPVVIEKKSKEITSANKYSYHVFREFSECDRFTKGSDLYDGNKIDCKPTFPSDYPSTLKNANSYTLSGFVYAIKQKPGILNRDDKLKYYPIYRLTVSNENLYPSKYIYENGNLAQTDGFYAESLSAEELNALFLY